MVPVTLFRSGNEFGVSRATNSMTARSRPSPNSILSNSGRLIEPAFPSFRCRLRAAGGKGSFAAVGCRSAPCRPRPCPLCSSRAAGKGSRKLQGERKRTRRADVQAPTESMEKKELEDLRDRVLCGVVLEQSGFAVDVVNRRGMLTPWRCGRKLGLTGDSSCIRTKTA